MPRCRRNRSYAPVVDAGEDERLDRERFARCDRCGSEATPGWTARFGGEAERERVVMCEHCMTPAEREMHADELRRESREMRGETAAIDSENCYITRVLERLDAMNEADALRADALDEQRRDE